MIYQSTINSLTEEELSILFFITEKFLSPLSIDIKINFVKMLKLNVIFKMIEILQQQALDENKNIFDSLKNKLAQQ